MPQSLLEPQALFQEIYEARSGLYIEMLIERHLPTTLEPQKGILQTMLELRSLDDIHALAADQLGLVDEAKAIRAFRAKRLAQPQPSLEELLG